MDRFEHSELEQDYTETRTGSGRKRKKFWIPTAAILTALLITVVSVVASAGPADHAAAISLTVAEAQDADTENVQSTGFVLTDVSSVVEDVLPSVVSITSRTLVNYYGNYGSNGGNLSDIFDYFFGDSYGGRGNNNRRYYYYEDEAPYAEEEDTEEEQDEVESGMGSGTIIAMTDDELLILTSYHVVEESSSLYVTFIDDSNVDGYIKSADQNADIAIVAVPLADIEQETLDNIKVATVSEEPARVGEGVIVIGNALGYGTSVTAGIVSAVDREITVDGRTLNVIQTDAAINFGNSGGCMLNSKGEVIGISEAKATVTYVEEMYYAIPVASNLELIQTLLNSEGTIDEPVILTNENNAYLGIRGRDVTMDISESFGMPLGVYVSSTVPGSGAEEAKVQSGDIIVGLDDEEITSMVELQSALSEHEAGDVVELEIMRLTEGNYESQTIAVTLTDRIS